MDKKIIILAITLLTGLAIASYNITFALFSNSATSTSNLFAAASLFPTPTPTSSPSPSPSPTIANHLVINEVLYDTSSNQNITGQGGSNRGEFIEIYNPTGSGVNVNGWIVEDNTSSETLPNITIPSEGFLILTGATESEFEAIWSVPPTVQYAQASGGAIGNGFANDGDLARLKSDSTTIIDQTSWGNDTSILNPAPTDVASGHSLERNPDGIDSDTSSDFIDQTTPTPGS